MRLLLRNSNAFGVSGLLLAVFLIAAPAAFAEKRVALVVGISRYQYIPPLDNPKNDARLMAETLRGLGFDLVGNGAQFDLDKPGFDRVVQTFGQQLVGANVALFYYAGHGLQVRGSNWLVPATANPTRETDVDFQMVDAGLVLRQMEGAGTKLNVMILDACRNNPFGGRGLRATSGGLAQMQAPEGTLISYATQPGNVAQDGAGGNSPFAKALSESMRRPGVDVFRMFNDVGLQVKRITGGAQQPWVSNSPIDGDFYFAGSGSAAPATAATSPSTTAAAPSASGSDAELVFWQTIASSANPGDFEEYLRQYPDGRFAGLARTRTQPRANTPQQQAAVVAPAAPPPIRPATDYPTGPVRMVVPFAPGGLTDVIARLVSSGLASSLNKSVIVENRPGAGGNIGFAAVATSQPDGHSLVVTPVSIVVNRALYAQVSFDLKRDLAPVILLAHAPYVLVVPADGRISSVRDLIAQAKTRQVSFATTGIGSFSHLAAEQFRQFVGIELEHVPYRGEGPALQDALAGRIQLMFVNMAAALNDVRAGRLRALAVTTLQRVPVLPDTPTLAEAGVNGYTASSWVGVMVQSGTPAAIVARLNQEMNAILRGGEMRERMTQIGLIPAGGTSVEFAQLLETESARWTRVVQAAGIKQQ